jgi:hypothetical protein
MIPALWLTGIAQGNPDLENVTQIDCTPYPHTNPNNNQTYTDNAADQASAAALAADGFACTALLNKGQLPGTFQHVGEAWFKTVGSTLQVRFILFGTANTGLSGDNKLCLDDDGDPINNIAPGGAGPAFCEGGDAAATIQASNANSSTVNCATNAPEPAGKMEYAIEKIPNLSFTIGGQTVSGWNVFIDACTEILPHFNANGFSIVAYFQPHVPVPDLRIKIEANDTNEVGDPHTFTVTVEFDADTTIDPPGFAPLQGVNPVVTLTGSNGIGNPVTPTANTCSSAGTDASGQCTVTVNSDDAGKITASASITHAGLTRDTNPSTAAIACGFGGNGDAVCQPAVKTYVDAYITIEADATNPIGAPHTFTVSVFQDAGDGNGFVAATVGNVDVTLTNAGGANAILDAPNSTCDDNQPSGDNLDASGQCTVTFTSNTAGTVTGHATVNLTVGGVALTRETDGVAPNSDDAVKTFVDGAIRIFKDSDKGGRVTSAGVVFDVDGPDAGDTADFSVTDDETAAAPDEDSDIGEICVSGLIPGATYNVTETSPPDGYGDSNEGTLQVVAATGDCSTVAATGAHTVTFTNPPLFDIIAAFRDAGSGQITIVSITCTGAGVNNNTLDGTPLTGWDASQINEDLEFVDSGDGTMTLNCAIKVDP